MRCKRKQCKTYDKGPGTCKRRNCPFAHPEDGYPAMVKMGRLVKSDGLFQQPRMKKKNKTGKK